MAAVVGAITEVSVGDLDALRVGEELHLAVLAREDLRPRDHHCQGDEVRPKTIFFPHWCIFFSLFLAEKDIKDNFLLLVLITRARNIKEEANRKRKAKS